MSKPTEKFVSENNVLKSGQITVYVMGIQGEERATMLQLMRLALNGYYFPLENMQDIIDSIPENERDTPETKAHIESLEQMLGLANGQSGKKVD